MVPYSKLKELRKKILYWYIPGLTGLIGSLSGIESFHFTTWPLGIKITAIIFGAGIILLTIVLILIQLFMWRLRRR